jgi:hypothetical protein
LVEKQRVVRRIDVRSRDRNARQERSATRLKIPQQASEQTVDDAL